MALPSVRKYSVARDDLKSTDEESTIRGLNASVSVVACDWRVQSFRTAALKPRWHYGIGCARER